MPPFSRRPPFLASPQYCSRAFLTQQLASSRSSDPWEQGRSHNMFYEPAYKSHSVISAISCSLWGEMTQGQEYHEGEDLWGPTWRLATNHGNMLQVEQNRKRWGSHVLGICTLNHFETHVWMWLNTHFIQSKYLECATYHDKYQNRLDDGFKVLNLVTRGMMLLHGETNERIVEAD